MGYGILSVTNRRVVVRCLFVIACAICLFGLGVRASAYDGGNGRDGRSITITADGTAQNYNISGGDGGDGSPGSDGQTPYCPSTGGNGDVMMPDGGDGSPGGDGGVGGDGGGVTVYYKDIENLKKIYVRGTPGYGGRGAPGGRGSWGCRCGQSSWTVTDAQGNTQTYSCRDGSDGRDGSYGRDGGRGSYGRIFVVGQTDPVKPPLPSVYIDMSKMETGAVQLSKNNWERRQGARTLFQTGSDISDNYWFFLNRTEVEYTFKWQARRPVTDFAGWHMLLQLDGTEAKLTFPNGLWVNSEVVVDGNKRTYVFHSAVSSGEIGNIQLSEFAGDGADLYIAVKDNAQISDVLTTSVYLEYYTAENGRYQVRYKDNVPAGMVPTTSDGFKILIGKLGIKDEYLKPGVQAYAGLTVTRALGTNSAKYSLSSYATIEHQFKPGDVIEAVSDADLYSGSDVVGHVAKGDKFHVVKVQGQWISLAKIDGTALKGWIAVDKVKASSL